MLSVIWQMHIRLDKWTTEPLVDINIDHYRNAIEHHMVSQVILSRISILINPYVFWNTISTHTTFISVLMVKHTYIWKIIQITSVPPPSSVFSVQVLLGLLLRISDKSSLFSSVPQPSSVFSSVQVLLGLLLRISDKSSLFSSVPPPSLVFSSVQVLLGLLLCISGKSSSVPVANLLCLLWTNQCIFLFTFKRFKSLLPWTLSCIWLVFKPSTVWPIHLQGSICSTWLINVKGNNATVQLCQQAVTSLLPSQNISPWPSTSQPW